MKNRNTKAKLLKKFESYVNSSKNFCSPSENILKIKPFIKQISRIFVPEVQSAKISPQNISQPTLKIQDKLTKPIFTLKKSPNEIKRPEVRSESTMASLQGCFSSDLTKSPKRAIVNKSSVIKIPQNSTITEKITRIYRVKSSKIQCTRKLTGSFHDSLTEYFSGISFPRSKNSYEIYKTCNLEYTLQGNNNSVNCIEFFENKLWSGGSDCSLRY